PILNALLSKDVTNVLAVVVRYFGGTLLGVPGLIHAYKTATAEALENALILEKTVNSVYELRFPPERMNDIMRVIKEENLHICGSDYDNASILLVEIRHLLLNKVLAKLELFHDL